MGMNNININDNLATKLDSDGIISPGKSIEDEKILVGKTMKSSEKKWLLGNNRREPKKVGLTWLFCLRTFRAKKSSK